MTDIRCPMCGKSNPAERDVCQYCQARLKPLIAGAPQEGAAEPDEDVPEWLRALRPAREPESVSEPETENIPEWLAKEEHGIPEADSPEASNPPDWLKSLRENVKEGAEEEDSSPESDTPEAELPDWLKGIRSQAAERNESDEPKELLNDAGSASTEPDWMKRFAEPAEEQPLKEIPPGGEADQASSEADVDAEQAGGLPAWLSEIGQQPSAGTPAEEVPSWLRDQPQVPDEPPAALETMPAWLAEAQETPALSNLPIETESVPTGLDESESEVPSSPSPAQAEESSPAWLEEFVAGASPRVSEDTAAREPQQTEVPDWLESYAASSAAEVAFTADSAEPVPDLTLDWLTAEGEAAPVQDEPPAATQGEAFLLGGHEAMELEDEGLPLPIEQAEVPEWLGKLPEGEIPSESSIPAEEVAGLVEAELPGWLSAMRPVEMAAPSAPAVEEGDRGVEESGPLAGLRSILPGKFKPGKVMPPSAYTVKLQVSETQQAHAALIESMIKSEGEAGKLRPRRASGHQALVPMGIFVLLFIAILWPVLNGTQSVSLPAYSQEIIAARSLINGLQADAPVLLAVDYEPGLTGEMEATANEVMDQLMVKSAYLAMVSTTPTGPAQAQRLVMGVNERSGHTYQDVSQYAILGYIPGGAAGLRSFAESPKRIMPYALNAPGNQPVWDLKPLSNIKSLADFGLIVVITEDPTTARTWVEQVQPLLGTTALMMVVSAQAEPMVRPYYESSPQQVQGIVAGLVGGASFENMTGRYNLARKYWDAYSLGILVLAAVVIIGGVVSLVLAWINDQRKPTGEVLK